LLPRWKIKLKGRHFDTTVLIETESQAVLNTLTGHDFQDAFNRWQKLRELCKRTVSFMLCWVPVPTAWRVLVLRMEERPPAMEVSRENIE
jgi:hypothetical protein